MNEELKPCPFCGSDRVVIVPKDIKLVEIFNGVKVMCGNIHCSVQPRTKQCLTENYAIREWNTRA